MTPFTSAGAFQYVDAAQAVTASTGQLVPASLADNAPWLYSALSQLHDIERAGRDIPGVGDLRITEPASLQVKTVLVLIDVKGALPTPTLYPISGGGVGMKWNVGTREVEFTTFANGNTIVAKVDNHEFVDDSELTGNPQADRDLNNYLGWLVAAR